jgi:hypothetical protein
MENNMAMWEKIGLALVVIVNCFVLSQWFREKSKKWRV